MQPFAYVRPASVQAALQAAAAPETRILAGGTNLVDLMKIGVERPSHVVDLTAVGGDELRTITTGANGLRFGALVTMAQAAGHEAVQRDYPALSEALLLAASPQLRNMASLAGNILQRTRCPYFRDISYRCNKREPGSGCDALEGYNRLHAVLGVSNRCIAAYPGDFAIALAAFDAEVELSSPDGRRIVKFTAFHNAPADQPHVETVLRQGEIITAITVPPSPFGRASTYYKVRDRESYAFANASAAVALALDGEIVREARIAVGGVAGKPWRAGEAEGSLVGKPLDEASARQAGEIVFAGASPRRFNAFKVPLGIETVTAALLSAKARA